MKLREAFMKWWQELSAVVQAVLLVCVTLLLVLLIATMLKWAPQWLASTKGLGAKDRAEEYGRLRTALLAVFAGALAAIGAIYTARAFSLNRQGHELARQGQITERFTRAIDQLGDDKLDVRLGGIYALEQLAHESTHYHGPIVEILIAYLREREPWPPGTNKLEQPVALWTPSHAHVANGTTPTTNKSPDTDVQAVLTVLGRRTLAYDTATIDLGSTALVGANLSEAHLERANLRGAHLERANLDGAHLEQANLRGAHLHEASLKGASLQGADLYEASLEGADLYEASLEGADLSQANLQVANLSRANLHDARLWDANLQEARLYGAHLERGERPGGTRGYRAEQPATEATPPARTSTPSTWRATWATRTSLVGKCQRSCAKPSGTQDHCVFTRPGRPAKPARKTERPSCANATV